MTFSRHSVHKYSLYEVSECSLNSLFPPCPVLATHCPSLRTFTLARVLRARVNDRHSSSSELTHALLIFTFHTFAEFTLHVREPFLTREIPRYRVIPLHRYMIIRRRSTLYLSSSRQCSCTRVNSFFPASSKVPPLEIFLFRRSRVMILEEFIYTEKKKKEIVSSTFQIRCDLFTRTITEEKGNEEKSTVYLYCIFFLYRVSVYLHSCDLVCRAGQTKLPFFSLLPLSAARRRGSENGTGLRKGVV